MTVALKFPLGGGCDTLSTSGFGTRFPEARLYYLFPTFPPGADTMESPSLKCPLTSAGARAKRPRAPHVNKARSSAKAGAASARLPSPTPPETRRVARPGNPSPLLPTLTGEGSVPVSEGTDAVKPITPNHLDRNSETSNNASRF